MQVQKIIDVLKNLRVSIVEEELDLQQQIATELQKAGVEFKREYRIGRRNRVDFMVAGGIVLEVKKGKPYIGNVLGQLERYAAFPEVKAIILVVERNLDLPKTINSKPCISFGLNKLWGIAL